MTDSEELVFQNCGHSTPEHDLIGLRMLADEIDAKKIAEVGCFVGQSTLMLAKEGRVIYCIDTFEGPVRLQGKKTPNEHLDIFLRNVGDLYPQVVRPIIGKSLTWAKNFAAKGCQFDMVFLDASHKFEDVCLDIREWWKCLRDGGLLVCHDMFVLNDVNKALLYCFGRDAKLAKRDIQCPRVDMPYKPRVPTSLGVIQK